MGDTKKLKKKYVPPAHPWIKATIDEHKTLKKEYGLLRRKEILLANSFLKKYKDIAKHLIANKTAQGEKEKAQMMDKLTRNGLLTIGASLDDVLSIQVKDILERRIQSLVFRKGMARSMRQARQFITHRHIIIGDKEITSPSRMLTVEEESKLAFKNASSLAKDDHPERVIVVKSAAQEQKEQARAEAMKKAEERRGGRREGKSPRSPQRGPQSKGPSSQKNEGKKGENRK